MLIAHEAKLMSAFTDLEMAVLNDICDRDSQDGGALRTWLMTANVSKRDNTGKGFYTHFDVQGLMALSDMRYRVGSIHLLDVGDDDLMLFNLWFKEERPVCLEGWLLANDVNLEDRDLTMLRFKPPALS